MDDRRGQPPDPGQEMFLGMMGDPMSFEQADGRIDRHVSLSANVCPIQRIRSSRTSRTPSTDSTACSSPEPHEHPLDRHDQRTERSAARMIGRQQEMLASSF